MDNFSPLVCFRFLNIKPFELSNTLRSFSFFRHVSLRGLMDEYSMATTRPLRVNPSPSQLVMYSRKWNPSSQRSTEGLHGCWRYTCQHWREDQIPLQTQAPDTRGTSRWRHDRQRPCPHLEMHRRPRLHGIQLRCPVMSRGSILWLAEDWCSQHLDQESLDDHYIMADDHT